MPFLPLVALLLAAHSSGARLPADASLEQALARIRPERIAADVRFLASAALEGRGPQSRGLRVAARYLVARARSRGWQAPLDEHLRAVDVLSAGLDLEGTSVRLAAPDASPDAKREAKREAKRDAGALVFGEHYAFLSGGYGNAQVDAALLEPDPAALVQSSATLPASWNGRALFVRDPEPLFAPDGLLAEAHGLERLAAAGVAALVLGPSQGEDLRARHALAMAGREQLVLAPEPLLVTRLTAPGLERVQDVLASSAAGVSGLRWQERRRLREADTSRLENVAAWFPGSGALADEVVLVSAHYDHLGRRGGRIHPGADDNASGVAALLALGEALEVRTRMDNNRGSRRSVVLAWLDGEEQGQLGAWAWTREPELRPGTRLVACINLDMVGRNAPDRLAYTPSPAHPRHGSLARLAASLGAQAGFPDMAGDDAQWSRSDHRPFAEVLGLPVVSLTSGEHEDYHGPGDTAERIDADKVARVAGLVLRLLVVLDRGEAGDAFWGVGQGTLGTGSPGPVQAVEAAGPR